MENLILGEIHAIIAGCQDLVGRILNGFQSMFTTKPKVVPLGEASLSIGNFSISGTASYENGKMVFSGTPGVDITNAQLSKLTGASVTLDTESLGINGDITIPTQWVVDVKVKGGVQLNKDGSVTITMMAGVGKNIKAVDASVSGGQNSPLAGIHKTAVLVQRKIRRMIP